jgi:uncharacterized protein (DUF1697 family)
MPRYFAFLRAVNVGGRVVKMDELRGIFERLEFIDVETFIASGNVIFESPARKSEPLERMIERALEGAFGYEVATFVRGDAELAAVAGHRPFPPEQVAAARSLNVGFLAAPPDAAARRRLAALRTDVDDFAFAEREVYWLLRIPQSESKLTNTQFERALGQKVTFRGTRTIERLAKKYALWDPAVKED